MVALRRGAFGPTSLGDGCENIYKDKEIWHHLQATKAEIIQS